MIGIPQSVRILIGTTPIDMRKSIDGDVLLRVQTHPASRIDELLPHRWKPPQPPPS